jgi:glycosyltransferase involved in cell wall biosynthesis
MRAVHLTASTFFGGPERQMLGLAAALPADHPTTFACFREGGRSAEFLAAARDRGFDALELAHDSPHLRAATRELAALLRRKRAGVLLCHGYKANLLGRVAARRAGVPAVAVSRGWTGEDRKVRAYETADRWHLRFMDHVVAVSEGQAEKVRACGVPRRRMSVIRNAARLAAFATPDPAFREQLRSHFGDTPVAHVVVAAGRLSPEKGFSVLADATARLLKAVPTAGVVLFGEGSERAAIEAKAKDLGIADRFVMPGFTRDLDKLLPWADLLAIPSFTEGLPNVALEASAAGVPVVATAVGGNPEVVGDGETGFIVPPGDPAAFASKLTGLLTNPEQRRQFGAAARVRMHARFTFEAQATAYLRLFERLRGPARAFRPTLEFAA